jgi:hypothetical protein
MDSMVSAGRKAMTGRHPLEFYYHQLPTHPLYFSPAFTSGHEINPTDFSVSVFGAVWF